MTEFLREEVVGVCSGGGYMWRRIWTEVDLDQIRTGSRNMCCGFQQIGQSAGGIVEVVLLDTRNATTGIDHGAPIGRDDGINRIVADMVRLEVESGIAD